VFLVILLILFGFCAQTLGKAIILPKRGATQPAKHFGANAGISQRDLRRVALASISVATARSVIANGYQVVANAAACFEARAKTLFPNLGDNKAVSGVWHGGYVRNRELGSGTTNIMNRFGDAIECSVTVTPKV
jgi:hypothetical protein